MVEAALSYAAPTGKDVGQTAISNFYTKARTQVNNRIFEINHVLIDAGAVMNLAPISVLRSIDALLLPTQDLVIRTAASNMVPLKFYTDLEIEVASVVVRLQIFAMPDDCELTYRLLLSHHWLRSCDAIGDYSKDTYVIRDRKGRNHSVERERNSLPRPGRQKVSMNRLITKGSLNDELVAELELDDGKSFEEILRQIASEVRQELEAFEDTVVEATSEEKSWESGYSLSGQELRGMTDGYQSEYSFEADSADENGLSTSETILSEILSTKLFRTTHLKN